MEYKIYTLSDPITNEIRYVGYTSTSLKERLRHHVKDCKYKKGYKINWIKKLLKQGLFPIITELYNFKTKEEAIFNEIKTIFEYTLKGYNLTNLTQGGEGGTGYKFTSEQIEISRKKRIGRKLPPCSEERKKKISQANKGRKLTEEQKMKMRAYVKTEEHKEKLRMSNLGKKLSEETKKKMSERMKKDWAEGKLKATRKGMKNSESHKEKMRGKNNPFYGKKHSPELMAMIIEKGKQTRLSKKLEKNKNGSEAPL